MPNEEMGNRAIPEPPDVRSLTVIGTTGGFLLFIALSMVAIFFYLKAGAPDALRQPAERPFPQPALQKAPQNDLKIYEAEQRAALSGYAWVDREGGVARIPIGEAMRIVINRGEHAYDQLDQAKPSAAATGPGGELR